MKDNERVPDLLVELYLLGELSGPKARDVELRLAQEPGGLERIAELGQSNEEILSEYPVMEMAGRIERAVQRNERNEGSADVIDLTQDRRMLAFAAAAVLMVSLGVAAIWMMVDRPEDPSSRPEIAMDETNSPARQGGGVVSTTGGESEAATDPIYKSRNDRARRLKSKFTSGQIAEGDEAVGLVLALERKANRALIAGDRDEVEKVCKEARQLDEAACPWLEDALSKLKTDDESLSEEFGTLEGDFESGYQLPPGVTKDPEKGRALFKEASKAMVKGDWNRAIEKCAYGLAHGDTRCHRVLGLSYKNFGRKKEACHHLKAIGAAKQAGMHCD